MIEQYKGVTTYKLYKIIFISIMFQSKKIKCIVHFFDGVDLITVYKY